MGEGTIIKGIGGFYYVMSMDGQIVTCRMRGSFRLKGIKPAVGDRVSFADEGDMGCTVDEIHPRDNLILRPYAANVSLCLAVFAVKDPKPDFLLLDKLLADNLLKKVACALCITKCDLAQASQLDYIKQNYGGALENIFFVSSHSHEGTLELKEYLRGKTVLLRGVTGAGKSSLINSLSPEAKRITGELSRKLKRGKNTTRSSELIPLDSRSFILDTPGFSDFTLKGIECDELWKYYPEFYEYSHCKYMDCVHLKEPECGIKKAVEENKIPPLRYANYKAIYEELKKAPKEY